MNTYVYYYTLFQTTYVTSLNAEVEKMHAVGSHNLLQRHLWTWANFNSLHCANIWHFSYWCSYYFSYVNEITNTESEIYSLIYLSQGRKVLLHNGNLRIVIHTCTVNNTQQLLSDCVPLTVLVIVLCSSSMEWFVHKHSLLPHSCHASWEVEYMTLLPWLGPGFMTCFWKCLDNKLAKIFLAWAEL